MTKEKFQTLCEQVLVPKIGDLLHAQLTELHDTLDIIARHLIRIEPTLGKRRDEG